MQHRTKKRFGQHFLHDEGILLDMQASIAPRSSDHIVEIGPGLGVLTRYLVDQVQQFDAIEIDRDLIGLLHESFDHHANFRLHEQDALTVDWLGFAGDSTCRVVGNLPYNISTPLLFKLFDALPAIKDMHFLLQKEVGDRLVAPVSTSKYGRLSVMAQYYCDVHALFPVGPEAFSPPPKVDSTFLRLEPHDHRTLSAHSVSRLSQVVATAFNQRRKTLRNSLSTLIDEALLSRLGIDAQKRAQDVSVQEYVQIANAIEDASISS